ncbi:MAG: TonB-dependent receptor plug domain-containing protein [Nitrincola lacisaponensis]|uniref:TonB-dependent receptor plug domain-containing protein n=1 Tax=Nitrincola lacisaponensis TaxID=267850 RepID=UPI003918D7ED
MNNICTLLKRTAFLAITAPLLSHASDSIRIDTLFVSATDNASPVQDVQASVQVITREELDRFNDSSVSQALKHAVGVSTSDSGTTADISIRGFNRNHTLVLINGQRRTNNYGSSNLNQISFFDIDRIEIIRGPLSSLYGSDALGGVVNVITRQPGENPGTSILVKTGTSDQNRGRESLQTGINFRQGSENAGHSLTLEQDYRNSFKHRDSTLDDFAELNNWSINYRGQYSFDNQNRLNWTLETYDRKSDANATISIDNPINRFEREKRYFTGIHYTHSTDDNELILRASAGDSQGSTNRSYPTIETTDFRQYQGDALYHRFYNSHIFSIGLGSLHDHLDVSINSQKATQRNTFFLLQDQWTLTDNWQLVYGARYDQYNDFGNTLNPRLSLGWSDSRWSARVGYGTAFRSPSLLEQYSEFVRGRLIIKGNTDLQPEESETWEAMIRRNLGQGYIEANIHHNKIENLIQSFTTEQQQGSLTVVEYRNIGQATIRGAELVAYWPLTSQLDLHASLEWLDAKDTETNERLTGRAKFSAKSEINYTPSRFSSYNLRLRHMNDYLSVDASAPRGAAPRNTNLTLTDISANFQLNNNIGLTVGIDNLFDNRDPENFTITSAGSQRNSPDARYFHLAARIDF